MAAIPSSAAPVPAPVPSSAAVQPGPVFGRFEDVIAHARKERDRLLVFELERHVRPIRFEPGRVEIALTSDAKADLPQRLAQVLKGWTGERWMVTVSQADVAETVHENRAKSKAALIEEVRADPRVRRVLDQFPGAEIVGVREDHQPESPAGAARTSSGPSNRTSNGE
jgi:DNA polymerase-3 subunit gamma/tau